MIHLPDGDTGWTYSISSGYLIGVSHSFGGACSLGDTFGCGTTVSKGGAVHHENYIVVERQGGDCGSFTLTIQRVR